MVISLQFVFAFRSLSTQRVYLSIKFEELENWYALRHFGSIVGYISIPTSQKAIFSGENSRHNNRRLSPQWKYSSPQ